MKIDKEYFDVFQTIMNNALNYYCSIESDYQNDKEIQSTRTSIQSIMDSIYKASDNINNNDIEIRKCDEVCCLQLLRCSDHFCDSQLVIIAEEILMKVSD